MQSQQVASDIGLMTIFIYYYYYYMSYFSIIDSARKHSTCPRGTAFFAQRPLQRFVSWELFVRCGHVCLDTKLQGILWRNGCQQTRTGMPAAIEWNYLRFRQGNKCFTIFRLSSTSVRRRRPSIPKRMMPVRCQAFGLVSRQSCKVKHSHLLHRRCCLNIKHTTAYILLYAFSIFLLFLWYSTAEFRFRSSYPLSSYTHQQQQTYHRHWVCFTMNFLYFLNRDKSQFCGGCLSEVRYLLPNTSSMNIWFDFKPHIMCAPMVLAYRFLYLSVYQQYVSFDQILFAATAETEVQWHWENQNHRQYIYDSVRFEAGQRGWRNGMLIWWFGMCYKLPILASFIYMNSIECNYFYSLWIRAGISCTTIFWQYQRHSHRTHPDQQWSGMYTMKLY